MATHNYVGGERQYLIASVLASKLLNAGVRASTVVPRSILVVKLDEIGDMALCTHVFALLKRDFPEAHITVLCKPFVKVLIEADPHINDIITSVDEWTRTFDVVVELRGTWATLRKALLMRPRLRLDRATVRLKNKLSDGQLHETKTNFQIIEPLLKNKEPLLPRIYIDKETRQTVRSFLQENDLHSYAVVAPGARHPLREWPPDRFASIIRWVYEHHGIKSICAGGPSDESKIADIIELCKGSAVAAPNTFSLSHFAGLSEGASLFIGNESGPLHIAASFGIPTVGLFGPGIPRIFSPVGSRSAFVHHLLACNPCDQIHCVHSDNPCIRRITTTEVREAIGDVLTRP
ncbi:MAG: glycosyltransferase family 9 protein [Candidatus Kapabacteria bacterium]|nr:glycosyltransferase family 9 protein [Candidatus Kapabacteria bacterium]